MKTLARLSLGIAAVGGAVTLAACADEYAYAPPPPPPAPMGYAAPAAAVMPACFFTRDIRNHTIGDDRTLYINVNDRTVYRIAMEGNCLAGATSSDPIVIRNPPGSNNVCRPIDLDIGIHMSGGAGFTSRCIVRSITPLTPAEVAALPPKLRP